MKRIVSGLVFFLFFILNTSANEVFYFWSGAITSHSGKVNAILKESSEKVRLVADCFDTKGNGTVYSEFASATEANGFTVSLEIENLKPNKIYYFSFEIDGKIDSKAEHKGSFQTYEVEGMGYNFKFVAGSCNFFPNNRVYDKMRAQKPLFLLMPGDLHYANPSSSDVEPHRTAYREKVLQQPRESKFLQHIPIAYVWDDHDYCGDNNDGSAGCGEAAYQAYKEYVPYYPLSAPQGSKSIYQAYTIGRVRFIMTDLRSERKQGDIMSATQKQWFKNEVIRAKNNRQLICWVSSVSFSGTGSDNWGAYGSARTEIANFFRDSNIVNMFIISGDAHMLAIDNGTHADFSDKKNNQNLYPILQSAALNNVGSDKGGEYSEGGTFPNPPFSSQWSTIEIFDNGFDEIWVRFVCYRMNLFTKKTKIMTHYDFARTLLPIDFTPVTFDQVKHQLTATYEPEGKKIGLTLDYSGKASISMINYVGKQVYNQSEVSINHSYQIDATNIAASGIHYIIIETPGGNYLTHVNIE